MGGKRPLAVREGYAAPASREAGIRSQIPTAAPRYDRFEGSGPPIDRDEIDKAWDVGDAERWQNALLAIGTFAVFGFVFLIGWLVGHAR